MGQADDGHEEVVDLLDRSDELVEVDGPKDFRLDRLRGARTWFGPDARADFEKLWRDMTHGMSEREAVLTVNERKLHLARTAGPMLRASFADLCAANNGPADYLAVAERFTTVFIDNVPVLSPDRRNEARRFVGLIDALYEAKTRTVVLAEAEPEQLYPRGDGAFEFERTVSRLEEMRSETYLDNAG